MLDRAQKLETIFEKGLMLLSHLFELDHLWAVATLPRTDFERQLLESQVNESTDQ